MTVCEPWTQKYVPKLMQKKKMRNPKGIFILQTATNAQTALQNLLR